MVQTISPKQLARAIGISESTMKRWADEGVVKMTKTLGGHRRIPIDEAISLIRKRALTLADPAALGISDLTVNIAAGSDPDITLYETLLC